jgi:uncharacterized protein (TIGR01777 family)
VRRPPRAADEILWDPAAGSIDAAALEGFDAVVHLSGQNIAGGRWTAKFKQKLRDSRLDSTGLLARTLAGLQRRPAVLICASAIGFYGDRGQEVLTEESAAGTGFLPELCQAWEAAAAPARDAGVRVVHPRIGVVLSPRGGALKPMLTPFKLGLGGIVGTGRQFWSWISLDDLLGVIEHCIADPGMAGPVNAVAPHPVTNREFTKTLGVVLHRPTLLPVPALVVSAAFGEMGRTLLLGSSRVSPAKLEAAGFSFRHPDLEGALRHALASE